MSDAAPDGIVDERSGYVPFVLLSGARTGSTMLARALNSRRDVRCFGEVFNYTLKGVIDFGVAGYDNRSAADLALREEDPVRFLRERIYGRHPEEVRAVGLKYHYLHFWGFPGVWEALAGDTRLRTLHLKRRNLLRMFASLQIARATGVWRKRQPPAPSITPVTVLRAVRHPLRAAARLRTSPAAPVRPEPVSVTVEEEEFRTFLRETEASVAQFDKLFAEHAMLTLHYEELEADPQRAFAEAQAFLDLKPRRLSVDVERQNPQPLPELVENFEALERAFRGSPYAWMFEAS